MTVLVWFYFCTTASPHRVVGPRPATTTRPRSMRTTALSKAIIPYSRGYCCSQETTRDIFTIRQADGLKSTRRGRTHILWRSPAGFLLGLTFSFSTYLVNYPISNSQHGLGMVFQNCFTTHSWVNRWKEWSWSHLSTLCLCGPISFSSNPCSINMWVNCALIQSCTLGSCFLDLNLVLTSNFESYSPRYDSKLISLWSRTILLNFQNEFPRFNTQVTKTSPHRYII